MATNPLNKSQLDTIRDELKSYRSRHGLTQTQVGSKLDVSQSRLSAFETGKNRSLRRDKLDLLSKLLRVEKSADVDTEEANILRFTRTHASSASDSDELTTGASSELRAEMKAQVLQTMGLDAIGVAVVDRMSDAALFKAYLISEQLNS